MNANNVYDLIIVGGGPAGLTAVIYALRAKLDVLLLEKTGIGGQIALSDSIENYPGLPPLSGVELMAKFEEQAKGFGLKPEFAEVTAIEDTGGYRLVATSDGDLRAKAVIVASGAKPRRLGIPGEAEFTGRGVSYCATCDGFFFRGKTVAVVGGGNTAVKEASFLTKFADKVHLIHRRDGFRAEKINLDRAFENKKIEWHLSMVVEEIAGEKTVEKAITKNVKSGVVEELPVDGVFIFVGILPNADFVDCQKDAQGFIKTDDHMMTSINGVFAAGDVRVSLLRQGAVAVGDGALAAYTAGEFIENL